MPLAKIAIWPTKQPENVQSKHQYIWVSPPVTRCGRTLPKNGTSSLRATSFRTWLEQNNFLKPPNGWLWNYPPDPPSNIAREIPALFNGSSQRFPLPKSLNLVRKMLGNHHLTRLSAGRPRLLSRSRSWQVGTVRSNCASFWLILAWFTLTDAKILDSGPRKSYIHIYIYTEKGSKPNPRSILLMECLP